MTDTPQSGRSYGCTFACGNLYDFIFISVLDGTTEFLCLPCMVRLAADMVAAVTDPDASQVANWLNAAPPSEQAPHTGNGARRGKRNAPATSYDPDLFDAYDSRIGASDLPREFR